MCLFEEYVVIQNHQTNLSSSWLHPAYEITYIAKGEVYLYANS